MSYGFKVTSDDKALGSDLLEAIAEIRIEQELSKATKFAIRFEDDLCNGKPKALSDAALKPRAIISVLVPDELDPTHKKMLCLIRGPVTKRKSSVVLGGPASWLEIHGEDRRVEMDRQTNAATWTGKAPSIAQAILNPYNFDKLDIKSNSAVEYTEKKSLNQSSTDLKVIENLARQLGYEFWITYDVDGSGKITETAHFKPSPDFGSSAGLGDIGAAVAAAASALGIDKLTQSSEKVLKLSIADKDCANVTAFDIDFDAERVTGMVLDGIDDKSGDADEHKAEDKQSSVDPKATADIKKFADGVVRKAAGAGSSEDRASEANATVSDEAWFITATASASAFKLPGVVQHHDIVSVEGTGFIYSGKYQVSKVVHVINGWGHLMDMTLRRNALPEAFNA